MPPFVTDILSPKSRLYTVLFWVKIKKSKKSKKLLLFLKECGRITFAYDYLEKIIHIKTVYSEELQWKF